MTLSVAAGTSEWSAVLAFSLYVALFGFLTTGIGLLIRRRRREREPLEFRLLRGPGESLRRKLAEMDDNFVFQILLGACFPIVTVSAALWLVARWRPESRTEEYLGLGGALVVFLLSLYSSGRWFWRQVNRRRNYRLGYLGERTVGEALLPLWRDGYRIFHDLPAETGDRKFNLDHVVVGPTGVFVVETKTRRKGRARPGFKEHEVQFDGHQLIWPWGEDRHGLEQAEAEARWLSEWLKRLTGHEIVAKPILALPGWYVRATARGAVNVVNAKGVPSAIRGRGQRVLSEEQIDIIARQLEERCRDVED
jgi:hypothetical protein